MAKIVLPQITNGQNISNINNNFQQIADQLNNDVLYRDNPIGEPNQLLDDIDMNGHNIINAQEIDTQVLKIQNVEVSPTSLVLVNSLKIVNNLSDVASVSASRTNLGLGNVDNTSDANKPVSTATQTALNLKANLTANTFTADQTLSYVSPRINLNDTGTAGNSVGFLKAGSQYWATAKNASDQYVVQRYVANVFQDTPMNIANATGIVTFTQSPVQPTPATADNSTSSATTAYVVAKLSTPTAIGNTTPNTGAFTTLSSTSDYSRTGAAGTIRSIRFQTAGVDRWSWDETSTAEGGANAGTNFQLSRYADAGTFIDSPISINRATGISTFSKQIIASAHAKVLANNTSAQSIPNNTFTTVTGWTTAFDLNTNFVAATGVFTAPSSGQYLVSAQIYYATAATAVGLIAAKIVANGADVLQGTYQIPNTTSATNVVQVNGLVSINAGQTIVLQAFQNSSAALALNSAALTNRLSITQIP